MFENKNIDLSNKSEPRKMSLILLGLIIVLTIGGIALGYFFTTSENILSQNQISDLRFEIDKFSAKKTIKKNYLESETGWWNIEYSFYKEITIHNQNEKKNLDKFFPISLKFDHAAMVDLNKSKIDGSDLRLYQTTDEGYIEMPYHLEKPNTDKTKIFFTLPNIIKPNEKSSSIVLYYGNLLAIHSNGFEDIQYLPGDEKYQSSLGEEKTPTISIASSRFWVLNQMSDPELNSTEISVELDPEFTQAESVTFNVLTTKTLDSGPIKKNADGKFITNYKPKDLKPGLYQVQATIIMDGKDYNSQRIPLIISEPLFIAHTVDWEGYDVKTSNLDALKAFSTEHNNLATTHFFNPRIYYGSDVKGDRTSELTNWVLSRQKKGDEIALHAHMQEELVKAAGVTPLKDPQIGYSWSGKTKNGYDVPNSAYAKNDYQKIIDFSLKTFIKNGLGTPTSFRGGLWWVDLENLAVLSEAGLKLDSSGRDQYTHKGKSLPWELTSTTQPYLISEYDQNKKAESKKESINLWEFPNNGGNTTIDDDNFLENSFEDNYKSSYLLSPRVITYLSHAQDFSDDKEDLDKIFNTIDENSVYIDKGPVVYVTLEDAYSNFLDLEED